MSGCLFLHCFALQHEISIGGTIISACLCLHGCVLGKLIANDLAEEMLAQPSVIAAVILEPIEMTDIEEFICVRASIQCLLMITAICYMRVFYTARSVTTSV